MAKDDSMQKELAEMRAKLQASEASDPPVSKSDKPVGEATADPGAGTGTASTPSAPPAAETTPQPLETQEGETPAPDLSTQFQELLEGLNRELKDSNPITLLAVFALGILFGRLLSR
jgi:hypothetical protein